MSGPDHPTMRAVTGAVAAVTDFALTASVRARGRVLHSHVPDAVAGAGDGFARFATGRHLPAEFAAAAARLRAAVAAHPDMLAGEGRFDTEITAALGEAAFVKTGAEGVHAGAIRRSVWGLR
ncbi:MAG: asparaginase [Rhodospirillales bacterium]